MDVSLCGGPNPPTDRADARPSHGGVFFHKAFELPAGHHRARVQIQFSPFAREDRITVRALRGDEVVAQAEVSADAPDALDRADALFLTVNQSEAGTIVFEGRTSAHAASTHMRFFTMKDGETDDAGFNFHGPSRETLPLDTVIIGTTAVCNANCSHCPTNKAYSKTQAKGVMSTELFERIVTQLTELGFKGTYSLGLHAEPLQDPRLGERVAFIRRTCPEAAITFSTNAAVYDPKLHAEALKDVDSIAVHIEAMSPDIYDRHMRPLKTHRTFPRAERLLADHVGRVHIVTPVHKDNLPEVGALKTHWEALGGRETEFAPLSNRCGQSPNYDALTVAPSSGQCGPDIVETALIVDWDGAVLTCCQDFHRASTIGDLSVETVAETMVNAERRRVNELLNQKRWGCLSTCAGCRFDNADEISRLVTERFPAVDHVAYGPKQFRTKGDVAVEDDGVRLMTRHPWGVTGRMLQRGRRRLGTIYGPYRSVAPGRYSVSFDLSRVQADYAGMLVLDVVDGSGAILARRKVVGDQLRRPQTLAFETEKRMKMEFRIRAKGVEALFAGVRLERVSADEGAGAIVPDIVKASLGATTPDR